MRDPYSILGVRRDAGSDEIKAAWRTKAKTVHPDQNRDDPQATARFAEIGRAYELLKDPRKRGLYDEARRAAEHRQEQTIMQQRAAAREAAERAKAAEKLMEELARAEARNAKAQPGGAQGAREETPEDMLARIFGMDGPNDGRGASSRSEGGREIPPDGSAVGAEKPGAAKGGEREATSPAAAFFTALLRRFRGATPAAERAPDITAEAFVTVHDLIEGRWVTIRTPDERDVTFSLEAGMTDGHCLRLKGQGLKLPDIARGDLVVTILVSRDEAFSVRGFDIHASLPVSLQDAVLGCETTIPSPRGGELAVTVPAWTGSDRAIRIAGKGLPDGVGGYGDFVLEPRIVLHEKPDAKVTDLMRVMRGGLYL